MTYSVDLTGATHDCGGHFQPVTDVRDVTLGQSRVPVSQTFFRCDSCAEERQTLEQLGEARRVAAGAVRDRDRLLAPSEVRRIRDVRLGLTQTQLEDALGLGEKTVVRWETGRVLQPKATDDLLRLLDRDASALGFLAVHNGSDVASKFPELNQANQVAPERSAEAETNAFGSEEGAPQVTIPRGCMAELQALASSEGVSVESFVVWALSERVSSSRMERLLGSDVTSMRRELEHIRASLERAWQPPRRTPLLSRDPGSSNSQLALVRNGGQYAQSA